MSRLLDAAGDAAFVFVTGKGGTGKTTTACAVALDLADAGISAHLISTDPAHSLGDVLGHPIGAGAVPSACSPLLQVEEFDAAGARDAWVDRALGPVRGIIEAGTYLDGEDVAAFSGLALPGLDEMMAVLRLADLADNAGRDRRVIVDTAPTGHTLRLLDAADTHESIARSLRAMAAKAGAVAGAMTGRSVRMSGEAIIDQMEQTVSTYRERVLAPAAFIIVTRAGSVVHAETRRLGAELRRRSLRTAALVSVGPRCASDLLPEAVHLHVPHLEAVAGCDGVRRWRDHVGARDVAASGSGPGPARKDSDAGPGPVPETGPAIRWEATIRGSAPPEAQEWLAAAAGRLLLFAGKGGVGKSTCAAAAALTLAGTRDVLLCSTDPAGSLHDVLDSTADQPAPRLRVMQIEPAAQLGRLRGQYQEDIAAALERVGLSESAALDRKVLETLWNLSPPGLDELAATAALIGAAKSDEVVVLDSSPTGHFLRLLEMPDIGLGWTRQLMRVFIKYGMAGVAGGVAESLLELSRELRALRDTLHDRRSAAVILVTLDQPAVEAETRRLAAVLTDNGMRVAAVLLNRGAGRSDILPSRIREWSAGAAVILAPALDPPPVGERALRRFLDGWNIVP